MVKIEDSCECGVLVLAAGQGKRMRSSLPKVLHEVGGKPILFHVLHHLKNASTQASVQVSVAIVVGHGREAVEAFVQGEPSFEGMKIQFIIQKEQKGTGHAARCAMDSEWGKELVRKKSPVLILPGDIPLISTELIREMILPLKKVESVRLLVCRHSNPTGYGRIVRAGKKGSVQKIVEEKDASPAQKKITEVATSIYSFQPEFLTRALRGLKDTNAQSEFYLTDVIATAAREKKKISVLDWQMTEDLIGVNDLWELSQAERIMNLRWIRAWAIRGVRFIDPQSSQVDFSVQIGTSVTILPGTRLTGNTQIGDGAVIGPHVYLKDVVVGEKSVVKMGTVAEKSKIGNQVQIGPYAHLRPESDVGAKSKIGNFVELKKTSVGENTSISHLSYLGDAVVGQNVNIGCGFVTCNFDGRVINGERKHKTVIEDDVFLGSDCQTVAPVKVGKGAFVASGSTVTQDVGAGDLAIARSRQVNKPGYARKLKQSKGD